MPAQKRKRGFSLFPIPHYGNYVGPYWSAGRFQGSVADSDVPAVDRFDETAKEHDAVYATTKDQRKLRTADFKFARRNLGHGILPTLAGAAVGLQGAVRSFFLGDRKHPTKTNNLKMPFAGASSRFPRPSRRGVKHVYTTGSVGRKNGFGTSENQSVTYLGLCSVDGNYDAGSMNWHLALALLRRIYMRFDKIAIADSRLTWDNIIPRMHITQGGPVENILYIPDIRFIFEREGIDLNEVYQNSLFNVPASETVSVTATRLANHLQNIVGPALQNLVDFNNVFRLIGYQIHVVEDFTTTVGGPTTRRWSPITFCKDWRFAMSVRSTVKVQNNTLAAGSSDTSHVESNPLVGRIFHFKHPFPVMRRLVRLETNTETQFDTTVQVNQAHLNDDNGDGFIRPPVSTLDANFQTLKQLPEVSSFENCSRYSNVRLAPGEIKSMYNVFKFYGTITDYFKNSAYGNRTSNSIGQTGLPIFNRSNMPNLLGTCDLLALKREIHDGTGTVKIQFESSRSVNVKWIRDRQKYMQPYIAVGNTVTDPDKDVYGYDPIELDT